MKAEYVNPFIEAAQSVFKTLLDTDTKLGKVYLKPSPFSVCDMIILIGVVGEIRGQVSLELTIETARKIASAMMGGMTVVDMDEISTSAIAELGNMIMGNTCSIFSKNKINIDISPPTILSGDKIKVSNKVSTIVIPLTLESYGDININVTAEVIL
jgi:chemotaxis protein CheX